MIRTTPSKFCEGFPVLFNPIHTQEASKNLDAASERFCLLFFYDRDTTLLRETISENIRECIPPVHASKLEMEMVGYI